MREAANVANGKLSTTYRHAFSENQRLKRWQKFANFRLHSGSVCGCRSIVGGLLHTLKPLILLYIFYFYRVLVSVAYPLGNLVTFRALHVIGNSGVGADQASIGAKVVGIEAKTRRVGGKR